MIAHCHLFQPDRLASNPAAHRSLLSLLALHSFPQQPSPQSDSAAIVSGENQRSVTGGGLRFGGDHHLSSSAGVDTQSGSRATFPLLPHLRGTITTGYKALSVTISPCLHTPVGRVLSGHPRLKRVRRPRGMARCEISKRMASWQSWQSAMENWSLRSVGGKVCMVVVVFVVASILLIN